MIHFFSSFVICDSDADFFDGTGNVEAKNRGRSNEGKCIVDDFP